MANKTSSTAARSKHPHEGEKSVANKKIKLDDIVQKVKQTEAAEEAHSPSSPESDTSTAMDGELATVDNKPVPTIGDPDISRTTAFAPGKGSPKNVGVKQVLIEAYSRVPVLHAAVHVMGTQSEDGVPETVPTRLVSIDDAFPSSPNIVEICSSPGSKNVKNLALVEDPSTIIDRSFFFVDQKKVGRFFTLGVVQDSSLTSGNNNRHLSVTPFDCVWHRAMAIAAGAVKTAHLYYNSYKGGVTFATQWKRSSDTSSSNASGPPKRGLARLSWDQDIPSYDGTREFNLAAYTQLPPVYGELAAGSAVLVVFTVSRYEMKGDKKKQYGLGDDHKHALSFNILAVVVLATPDERSNLPLAPNDKEHAYGVLLAENNTAVEQGSVVDEVDEGEVML